MTLKKNLSEDDTSAQVDPTRLTKALFKPFSRGRH